MLTKTALSLPATITTSPSTRTYSICRSREAITKLRREPGGSAARMSCAPGERPDRVTKDRPRLLVDPPGDHVEGATSEKDQAAHSDRVTVVHARQFVQIRSRLPEHCDLSFSREHGEGRVAGHGQGEGQRSCGCRSRSKSAAAITPAGC